MRKELVSILLISLTTTCAFSQENLEVKKDTIVKEQKKNTPRSDMQGNVMLNASDDQGPRKINIGLPALTSGTTIAEDGLLVSYNPSGQKATSYWRQDGSYDKTNALTLAQSAIKFGEINGFVSSQTKHGTDKFSGSAQFNTNSFGLLRGNILVSGPAKNNWFYTANAFVNMDPGTSRSDVTRFTDQTVILKGIVNKVYNNGKGEIGINYSYANSKNISIKSNPYIYTKSGKVKEFNGLTIGETAYFPREKTVFYKDPFDGQIKPIDIFDDTGADTHQLAIFGKNELNNGYDIDYIIRYTNGNSGSNSYNANSITKSTDKGEGFRYVYADNPNQQVYNGYIQNSSMTVAPKSRSQTLQGRVEVKKQFNKFKMMVGANGVFYNADKIHSENYSFLHEVANNPRVLIEQKLVDGNWVNSNADQYGNWNYNGSLQYYNGNESRMAIYTINNWDITPKLSAEIGARLENLSFNGDWYSEAKRSEAPDRTWLSGDTEKIKRNFVNKNFSLSLTYKVNNNWGVLGEASYFEKAGGLYAYAGADNPSLKQSKAPYFSAGVYLNNDFISLVSKVSQIKMTNIAINGSFNNTAGEFMKKTFNYDVKTIGWTTDMDIKPFKNFNLHLLLTMQDPQYDKFEFEVYGDEYDYKGKILRSTPKTIIEIDPSYVYKNFKFWASARYFGKEQANYPNSVFFAARWETFAGIDYKMNKNVNFSINAINILNQSGAQGTVSGGNTVLDGSLYYDKPMAGTYIRPFTVEFKTSIKF